MTPAYGVISDDVTGALLVASYFEEAGHESPVFFDPERAAAETSEAPILVLAQRTRLVPVAEARAAIATALDALVGRGCRTVAYKACASFDSTPEGNIGLAADMLADRLDQKPLLISAGFPEFRCTVHQGHLFYQGAPVHTSVKRFDPVTPMPDPDLVRFLSLQTRTPLGLVSHLDLLAGEGPARQALAAQVAAGHRHVLLDCSDDADVAMSVRLAADSRAIVASDPLVVSLGLARAAGRAGTAPPPRHAQGPAAVLGGSVGPVAEAQLDAFAAEHPVLRLPLSDPAPEAAQIARALDWATPRIGTPLAITTCTDTGGVQAAQALHGRMGAARRAERLLAGIATGLRARGIRRLVVAGGETSGAVMAALGVDRVRAMARGPLGGGFCVTQEADPMSFFLKSGKLGSRDVLLRALEEMEQGAAS
ncbi:four-carbon acid sugar kinase family protein [Pseudooceanicola aestuarii]|uniref:four-carbon acid sugar kinase family protein n=1 Tax=Pseudooceanicola aestuarii TaxID=2697319 RepID=UPI0013CF7471|nr:four-carbon acid sugar kinase family protein [Pseudooceanicola aestuarii]